MKHLHQQKGCSHHKMSSVCQHVRLDSASGYRLGLLEAIRLAGSSLFHKTGVQLVHSHVLTVWISSEQRLPDGE